MFKNFEQKFAHGIHSFYRCCAFLSHHLPARRIAGLIFLGIVSRLLPHPPNFTAINAIALFSICTLGSLGTSLFTLFTILFITDLGFGFHSSMGFVFFAFGSIILMGYGLKSNRSLPRSIFLLALSSLLFFVITNLGVWLVSSMYPKTLAGLELCYLAAIPFLANNLIGTLLYGCLLFGWLAFAERGIPAPRAHLLFYFNTWVTTSNIT